MGRRGMKSKMNRSRCFSESVSLAVGEEKWGAPMSRCEKTAEQLHFMNFTGESDRQDTNERVEE